MPIKKYKWSDRDVEVEKFLFGMYKKSLWFVGFYPRVDGLYFYLSIFQASFITASEWFCSFIMFISIIYSTGNIVFAMRFLRLGFLCLAVNMWLWSVLLERGRITEMLRLHLDNYYDYEEDCIPEGLEIIEKHRRSRLKYFLMIPLYGLYTGVSMLIVPSFYFENTDLREDKFDTKSIFPTWSPDPNSIWARMVFLIFLVTFIAHLLLETTVGFWFLIQFFEMLIGQVQVLNHSIGRLEERVEAHFNKMRKKDNSWSMEDSFDHCIKQNVQHHLILFEFKSALERLISFGIMSLSFNAITILAANAFLLVIQGDHILIILAISGFLTEAYFLLTYNAYGELLIAESEKLHFTLYNLNWFNFSPRQNKMINIMQIMTKNPMRMSHARGQMCLELMNFIKFVKMTYSLINFLIAVN